MIIVSKYSPVMQNLCQRKELAAVAHRSFLKATNGLYQKYRRVFQNKIDTKTILLFYQEDRFLLVYPVAVSCFNVLTVPLFQVSSCLAGAAL